MAEKPILKEGEKFIAVMLLARAPEALEEEDFVYLVESIVVDAVAHLSQQKLSGEPKKALTFVKKLLKSVIVAPIEVRKDGDGLHVVPRPTPDN